jgi:malate dehydrogenase (oxaloacetate-decarboxylating)
MAIRAAHSLADYAEKRGIDKDNILPTMDEVGVFPQEAADVAMQAIADGVARISLSRQEAYDLAKHDIDQARSITSRLMQEGYIKEPPASLINEIFNAVIKELS